MAKKKTVEVTEKVEPDAAGVAVTEPKKLAINDEQIEGLSALAPSDDFVPSTETVAVEKDDGGADKKQALEGLVVVVSGLVDSFLPGYGLVDAEVVMVVEPLDAVLDKYCGDLTIGPEASLAVALMAISAPRVIKYRKELLVSAQDNKKSGADDGSESKREST